MTNLDSSGVDNLRVAIVKKACKDYMKAYCNEKLDKQKKEVTLKEIEQFFRSDWFLMLTWDINLNPENCILRLRQRALNIKRRKELIRENYNND